MRAIWMLKRASWRSVQIRGLEISDLVYHARYMVVAISYMAFEKMFCWPFPFKRKNALWHSWGSQASICIFNFWVLFLSWEGAWLLCNDLVRGSVGPMWYKTKNRETCVFLRHIRGYELISRHWDVHTKILIDIKVVITILHIKICCIHAVVN